MAKARSLNKVILVGNLTRDPILRTSGNGVVVCTFGVATNTTWKDGSGNVQERAEFHNIVAFNKLAEICAQVLATGMLVYLEGEIRSRQKETKEGFKYFKTEIKINDMILLNGNDREPVGVDKAMAAGQELQSKLGTTVTPADEYTDSTVPAAPVQASTDEDLNGDDLF